MENAPPQFCGLSDTHGSYAILVYIVDSERAVHISRVYRHLATDRRIMTSIVGIRVGGFIQPQISLGVGEFPLPKVSRFLPQRPPLFPAVNTITFDFPTVNLVS